MPWTTLGNGLQPGWSAEGPQYQPPAHVQGWSAEGPQYQPPAHVQGWYATVNRGTRVDATGSLSMTAMARYPRNLELAVAAAVSHLAAQIEARALSVGASPVLVASAVARQLSSYAVTAGVSMDMAANTGWDASVDVLVSLGMAALERYERGVGVDALAALSVTAMERYPRDVSIAALTDIALSHVQVDPRTLGLGADAGIGASGFARLAASYGYTSATDMSVASGFPSNAPSTSTVTSSGSVSIPYWCTYIDVIALGGGSSGQTGNGSNNVRGDGGKAGTWAMATLQRGTHLSWTETAISVTVGAGGAQPANSDHAGPNGGSSTIVTVPGYGNVTGKGGSGKTGSQDGEGGGTQTLSGVTYTRGGGGTGNGGAGSAPGGGGAGGNGGIFGSRTRGGGGGAGRAWLRFYQ